MPSLGDLLLAHDYEAAVGPVEAAVSNASPAELPTLLLLLGAVQERLGKRDLARSAWRRALALEGFDAVSWSGNLVHTSGSLLASREAMRALITANNGRVDGGDARLLDLVGILARDTGPRGARWDCARTAFRASQRASAAPLSVLALDDDVMRSAFSRAVANRSATPVTGAPALAVLPLLSGGTTYGPTRKPPAPPPPRAWKANNGEVPPSAVFSDRDVLALRCTGGAVAGPCATLVTRDGHLVVGGHLWSEPVKMIDVHALAAAARGEQPASAREVPSPCVVLVSASLDNHYHAAAEGVSRVAFAEVSGLLAHARSALLPPREDAPLVWEAFGAACARSRCQPAAVTYQFAASHRADELWIVDWVPRADAPDAEDLWCTWQPPRAGFVLGAELLAAAAAPHMPDSDSAQPCVVYVRRRTESAVRGTLAAIVHPHDGRDGPPRALRAMDDDALIEAARTAAEAEGLAFRVFDAPRDGKLPPAAAHAVAMRGCVVLIGPHGAGLVNALFVPEGDNASRTLVEFPVMPYVNPAYAQVASSLGWSYDFVESVRSPHYGTFDLTHSAVGDVATSVRKAAARWREKDPNAELRASDIRASLHHVAPM